MAEVQTGGVPIGSGEAAREAREELRRHAVPDEIFDRRAILAGLLLSFCVGAVALVYRLSTQADSLRRRPPQEFEFSIAEPQVEEFHLKPPVRDILEERPEQMSTGAESTIVDETPNIHITTNPTVTAPMVQQYISSSNIQVDTPNIEIGGTSAEVGISEAAQEISQVTDTVTYALNVIAADTTEPADLFKYKDPTPRDRPATSFFNTGPRPGRPLKLIPKAWGEQDLVGPGQLGPMNINLDGTGERFLRMGRAGDLLKARSSVDNALHWLALHQGPDGLWHAEDLEGEKNSELAVTGLALLAFMGGGNTARKGEYMRNVLRGMEALLKEQDPDGGFCKQKLGNHGMYTHAICTIALCEAYGRARDDRVGLAAQKAVTFCEKAVNADGGWRYRPRYESSDMSVSAWVLQALKTAKLAQLKFDNAVFSQGLSYADSVTDKGGSKDSTGAVGYQFTAGQEVSGGGHPALTAAAMLVRQFTGTGVRNHLLVKAAEWTRRDPPSWSKKDFYYWYYATYAMHNMGGEYRIWWNKRIRDVLLDNQVRGGEHSGSWDPKDDHWAKTAGRTYTTALGALCLEVYYRYSEALNSFGTAPELDELFFEQ